MPRNKKLSGFGNPWLMNIILPLNDFGTHRKNANDKDSSEPFTMKMSVFLDVLFSFLKNFTYS